MRSHGVSKDDGQDEEGSGWRSAEEERGAYDEEDGSGGSYLPYFLRHEGDATSSEGDYDEEDAGGMDVMDAFEDFNTRVHARFSLSLSVCLYARDSLAPALRTLGARWLADCPTRHHFNLTAGSKADAGAAGSDRAQGRSYEYLAIADTELTDMHGNEQLFDLSVPGEEDANAKEDADGPAEMATYMHMSDQVRLSKPPQFERWQSCFQYLQVAGSAMLGGPSEDHICMIPGVPESSSGISDSSRTLFEPLVVSGRRCLTMLDEENETSEEIIETHGVMEEVLAHDLQDDDHDQSDGESVLDQGKRNSDCVSPRTTQMLEVVDALTFDCFSTTVAPLMTSFFQVLLQKQQAVIRIQREAVENAAKRTVEKQLAAEQAERIREERRVIEEAERAAAIAKAAEEEAIREAERQELLRQHQREENDDEEVKIRTLAYSHTREWYQPNKKCFSHRGRQLTYLKPVLTTKEQDDSNNTELVCSSSDQDASSARKPSKKPFSVPQKPSRAHPGSLKAFASSSLKGVHIRQQQRRPSSHSRSPPHSRSQQSQQRYGKEEKEDESCRGKRVRLPLIRGPWSGIATEDGRTSFSRCSDDSEDGVADNSGTVHSSQPANVYTSSPYRIPPPAVSVELAPANKTRRRGRNTRDIHNPA